MNKWIETAQKQKRNLLEPEAWSLLADYGFPLPKFAFVTDAREAVMAAEKLGYPLAVKIVSADILHKSEAGGVKINLGNAREVEQAAIEIVANAKKYHKQAQISGLMVCEMLKPGLECIIGMTEDASFGPAFMFGVGGIFVEILKDVSFRVQPLDIENARAMIQELKCAPLLTGARGQKPLDTEAVAKLLCQVAKLVEENPEIKELDINPCFVYEHGVMLADARIML